MADDIIKKRKKNASLPSNIDKNINVNKAQDWQIQVVLDENSTKEVINNMNTNKKMQQKIPYFYNLNFNGATIVQWQILKTNLRGGGALGTDFNIELSIPVSIPLCTTVESHYQ